MRDDADASGLVMLDKAFALMVCEAARRQMWLIAPLALDQDGSAFIADGAEVSGACAEIDAGFRPRRLDLFNESISCLAQCDLA